VRYPVAIRLLQIAAAVVVCADVAGSLAANGEVAAGEPPWDKRGASRRLVPPLLLLLNVLQAAAPQPPPLLQVAAAVLPTHLPQLLPPQAPQASVAVDHQSAHSQQSTR